MLHTRGMGKLGRPEIVATCSPAQAPFVAEVIWQIADGMAQGFMPASPRHGVDLPEGGAWYLTPDAGVAAMLELNNDALLLLDESGRPLVASTLRV